MVYFEFMMTSIPYYCQKIEPLTDNISLLVFSPISHQKISFSPGQYVEVLLTNSVLQLSIANPPTFDGKLEFHLRHDSNHPLAQELLNEIKKEQTLQLNGPFGDCTLARAIIENKLLFLAGGTGFAPIKTLLHQWLYDNARKLPTFLYWGVRRPEDAYDEKLLKEWQKEFPHFFYEIVLSTPSDFPQWTGPRGWVHSYLAKKHPLLTNLAVFASGPFPMILAAKELFTSLGLKNSHFFSDMINE